MIVVGVIAAATVSRPTILLIAAVLSIAVVTVTANWRQSSRCW